jgi:1-deoxyxylulose-5-phosphate synthase
MRYARLGSTGLTVSRVALGCMSYGDPGAGLHSWTLDEEASRPFFRQAVELGVTFWDTANVYQQGTSEEYVGRAVRRYARRQDVVLATKVFGRMHDGPTGAGLSRAAIHAQCDASLQRLGTDWIDVYFIHRFDDTVSVEETMEALHDLVVAGKVRHLGASSMWAWQFAKMQTAAVVNGWTPFAAMQDQFTSSSARRSARCYPCAQTWASASSRTRLRAKGDSPDLGGSRRLGRPLTRSQSRSTHPPISPSSRPSRPSRGNAA